MRSSSTIPLYALLLLFGIDLPAQDGSIMGMVTDDRGTPLAFTNVVVEGSGLGAITNTSGHFTLQGLSRGEYVITATSVGYNGMSIKARVPQTGTMLTIQLTERVVDLPAFTVQNSMTGGSQEVREVDGAAWYIGPKELQQQGYTDILRVLRSVPGVNIQEEDGLGLRPNIGLRGAGAERSAKITLMEDGILMAPAPYAAPAAYYFPTVGRMQGIEVVKGSSQIRYGPLTTGGALNLLSTAVPERGSGLVDIQGGDYGTRNIHAFAGTEKDGVGILVETFLQATDGFKELDNGGNTGTAKSDYLAKLQWQSKDSTGTRHAISLKAGLTNETGHETYLGLSDDDFATSPYRRYAGSQMDRIEVEHDLFTAQYALTLAGGPRSTITAYRTNTYRNWYKLDKVMDTTGTSVGIAELLDATERYPTAFATVTGSSSSDDALRVKANNRNYRSSGLQFIATHSIKRGIATHGLELGLRMHEDQMDRFQHVDGYRMSDGTMMLTDAGRPGTESNRIAGATAIAAHFLYDLQIGRFGFHPGIRNERISMSEENYGTLDPEREGNDLKHMENNVDVWIPGFGMDVDLHRNLNTFLGVHKGFSPPGTHPGTMPESSINYEAGLRMSTPSTTFQLIGFLNDYSELLGADMAASGGQGSGELFNGGKALVQGIECHLSHDPLQGRSDRLRMPISLGYTFTDARFGSTFESTFEGWGSVVEGDRIPYIPVHQLNGRIGMEGRKASFFTNVVYVGDVPAGAGNAFDQEKVIVPSFVVFDLAATYRWTAMIELFGSIQNLLNDAYLVSLVPAGARPGAPRMVRGGMRFRF